MNFLKKLFGIKDNPETISINIFDKEYIVDVSQDAQKKRHEDYETVKTNSWKEIIIKDFIKDDGTAVYKPQIVNSYEKELVGFYGYMKFSQNKKYCVVFIDGLSKNEKGIVALVDTTTQKLLYKINVNRPHNCNVSDSGLVVCTDWHNWDSKASFFLIFDIEGNVFFSKKMNESIGYICEINAQGTLAAFDTFLSNNIKIVDIKLGKIILTFSKENTKTIDIDLESYSLIVHFINGKSEVIKI